MPIVGTVHDILISIFLDRSIDAPRTELGDLNKPPWPSMTAYRNPSSNLSVRGLEPRFESSPAPSDAPVKLGRAI